MAHVIKINPSLFDLIRYGGFFVAGWQYETAALMESYVTLPYNQ